MCARFFATVCVVLVYTGSSFHCQSGWSRKEEWRLDHGERSVVSETGVMTIGEEEDVSCVWW